MKHISEIIMESIMSNQEIYMLNTDSGDLSTCKNYSPEYAKEINNRVAKSPLNATLAAARNKQKTQKD